MTKKSAPPVVTAADSPEKYVDVAEAAEIVKVSEATIRRKLGNGEIPKKKFGHRTLIRLSDLLALVR